MDYVLAWCKGLPIKHKFLIQMWNPHNQLTGPNLTASLVSGMCPGGGSKYLMSKTQAHFQRHSDINGLSILSRRR